jgi:hypothetical protein
MVLAEMGSMIRHDSDLPDSRFRGSSQHLSSNLRKELTGANQSGKQDKINSKNMMKFVERLPI